MRNITTDQDLVRHNRLKSASLNPDIDGKDYRARYAKHYRYCTQGTSKNHGKVYFESSPVASIRVEHGGFIVHDVATGNEWPFATWEAANLYRGRRTASHRKHNQLERQRV